MNPKLSPKVWNWIESILANPLERHKVLNIYGPQCSGRSTIVEWLIGYMLPYPAIMYDPTTIWWHPEDSVICLVEELDFENNDKVWKDLYKYLLDKTLTAHEAMRSPRQVPNYTQWIIITEQKLKCPDKLKLRPYSGIIHLKCERIPDNQIVIDHLTKARADGQKQRMENL